MKVFYIYGTAILLI